MLVIPAIDKVKGEGGFVVDPADIRDFALRMRFMLDARLRARMSTVSRQIGDYYAACMDDKGIDARGLAPS